MPTLMIYGATGYTGRMASEEAKRLGLKTILAGRALDSLKEFSASLDLPFRIFDVAADEQLACALEGIDVLLNCAGPFHRTAEPLIAQCIRDGVHYLDIAAEMDSYRISTERDSAAKQAKVMLLPGCGGSVAMLGCLTGYVVQRHEEPASIDIALQVAGSMSRGSAISAQENLTASTLQRLGGHLVGQDAAELKAFDFGDGKGSVLCSPVTLPDLITLWRSTGAPNIKTFVHVSGDMLPSTGLESLSAGPSITERESNPYHTAVTVTAQNGTVKKAVLHTMNGYTFTSIASVEAARRVLGGNIRAGFQTPVEAFGSDFIRTIEGLKSEVNFIEY